MIANWVPISGPEADVSDDLDQLYCSADQGTYYSAINAKQIVGSATSITVKTTQ